MKRLLLLTALILAAPTAAYSYSSQRLVKTIRSEDGLSNDYVVSLSMDGNGQLWIGTDEGLNSFDGVKVRTYTKKDGAIPGNALNDVLPDSDGIWVATQRAGFAKYSYAAATGEFFSQDGLSGNSLSSNEITHLEKDAEGNIWLSTYTKGMEKYDVRTGKFTHYNSETVEGMPDYSIIKFTIGSDGRLYLGHYDDGLTILDPVGMKARNLKNDPSDPDSLPSDLVGDVHRDPDNNIWVGTKRGLALYRPVTDDFKVFNQENSGLPNNIIYSIFVSRERQIYVSPNFNGVWVANIDSLSADPKFSPLAEAAEISNLPVNDMCEDAYGNLYIGSYGHGVLFIGGRIPGFKTYSGKGTLSAKNVTAIAPVGNRDEIAVGTQGGGIDIMIPESAEIFRKQFDSYLTDKSIMSLYRDSQASLWIGSFDGATVVVDSNSKHGDIVEISEARCFLERQDTMWIASGLGLYAVGMQKKDILYRIDEVPMYLRALAFDMQGRLWVGSFNNGLYILDRTRNETVHFCTDTGFPSNTISAMLFDGDVMYVGTGEGLVVFDILDGVPQYSKCLTMADGISSDVIKSIVKDNCGNLWFTTNLSVCCLNQSTGRISEYRNHSGNGVTIGNFNVNSRAILKDGSMFFGSTEGMVSFYPDELIQSVETPTVSFKSFVSYGKNNGEKEIQLFTSSAGHRLNWRRNNFIVTFSVDNYSYSDIAQYLYKVDNGDWYPVQESREIAFRDMPPGKHEIMVCARIRNGEPGPAASLKLFVGYPPFWSPVSIVLYAIVLIGLLLLIFRMSMERDNVARTKRSNAERLRFMTNIAHELRTPLTLIAGPMDDLKSDESLSPDTQKKVQILSKNVNRLLGLVNRLLDFRKVENSNYELNLSSGDLSEVVEQVGRAFFDSNGNRSIKTKMDIPKRVLGVFDPGIVGIVLNNLLSNAFKFTQKGVICLSMSEITLMGRRFAEIIVADTGKGIPEKVRDKIFDCYFSLHDAKEFNTRSSGTGIGLHLVKSLVELHGGSVEVESEPGRGSNFRVILPLEEKTTAAAKVEEKQVPKESGDQHPIIMVAEDNDDIRNYIAESLPSEYVVYEAADGKTAWELIVEHMPDLIISDIMMPKMDGLQLCRLVKQDLRFCHIPFMLLTAKDSIDDRSEGYKAGADSYLVKPFTGELLRARTNNIFAARAQLVEQLSSSIVDRKKDTAVPAMNEADREFIDRINRFINDNLASAGLDVSTLAETMNMSNSTLYRKLKSLTGMSANELIRKIRLHKAAELISSGHCNVSEAAWSVGMESVIHFRTCFKEEFGCLPSEYRKQRKSGQEQQA